jgi:hypothetical protein
MPLLNSASYFGTVIFSIVMALSPHPRLYFADLLFKEGQYDEAITEYKRYLFFHASSLENDHGYVYEQMGLAFRSLGLWDQAIGMLSKAVQSEVNEDLRDERQTNLGITLIACGRYDQATLALYRVESYGQNAFQKRRAAFFRGIASLYRYDWDEAIEAFRVYFQARQDKDNGTENRIFQFLNEIRHKRFKSASLARTLSTLVPGLGQIYSSDWAGGLNAFAINAAAGYLVVQDIVHHNALSALFNLTFLFERFYSGNKHNAADAANKYNEKMEHLFTVELLKWLEKDL